ncbi:aminoglycoside phosphotransferase family protein [Ktedonobacteria bacterium brp13]|nr:aminoglycoside phosphotransferase family protein [Ktedonobacteria bacterium brp13]
MLNITEEQLVTPIALDIAYQTLLERLPERSIEKVRYLPGGGSFSVFALNNEMVTRFPKFLTGHEEFQIVEEQFQFEKLVMNAIYSLLAPHQVARPTSLLSGPSQSFPGPVLCYELFDGTPISQLSLDHAQQRHMAALLGDFFSRLHSIDRARLAAFGFFDVEPEYLKQGWFDSFERNRQTTFQLLNDEERTWFTHLYEDFLADATAMQPRVALCHGDCTVENVMLATDHSHLQVIDWDDMQFDDPARDFCEWLGDFGEGFLHSLLDHYTLQVDPFFVQRAKFYYCRIPLLYFAMAQQYESSRFLTYARGKYMENREKCHQQGWFRWS